MKIKYELVQNIILLFLSIIMLSMIMLVFNKLMYPDYDFIQSQLTLLDRGINIIFSDGRPIDKQQIAEYQNYVYKVDSVKHTQIQIIISYIVLGLVLLIYSIVKKIALIESIVNNGIDNLESLQLSTSDSKYTEIQRLNSKFDKAVNKILQNDAMRVELYENMVHDFVTPLHILKGNLELLNKGINIDINVLNKQVERLEHLAKINIQSQVGQTIAVTDSDIETYVALLQNLYPNVKIKSDISADISFDTKSEYLYRIIDNIVNNAVKHGKPSYVLISLKMTPECYLMSFENDGKPIDKKLITTLFDRNISTTSSGIGLDIVSQLITELGYQLTVESNSQTTNFCMRIPKTGI